MCRCVICIKHNPHTDVISARHIHMKVEQRKPAVQLNITCIYSWGFQSLWGTCISCMCQSIGKVCIGGVLLKIDFLYKYDLHQLGNQTKPESWLSWQPIHHNRALTDFLLASLRTGSTMDTWLTGIRRKDHVSVLAVHTHTSFSCNISNWKWK